MENKFDIPVRKLYIAGLISTRAQTACGEELLTLADIIKYGRKRGTFRNLCNCGIKTDAELMAVCVQYEQIASQYEAMKLPEEQIAVEQQAEAAISEALVIYRTFDKTRKTQLHRGIKKLTGSLTARSRNAFNTFATKVKTEKKDLIEEIYHPQFYFGRLWNVGQLSEAELNVFKNKLSSYIQELNT